MNKWKKFAQERHYKFLILNIMMIKSLECLEKAMTKKMFCSFTADACSCYIIYIREMKDDSNSWCVEYKPYEERMKEIKKFKQWEEKKHFSFFNRFSFFFGSLSCKIYNFYSLVLCYVLSLYSSFLLRA
jgi:hypothetical protein